MILNTQDFTTLQKILGKLEIPEAVEQEYAIRAQMYHTEGTGALGIAMLIDLVRSLGYKPPTIKPPGEETDWRSYPQNGLTKIESMFFGSWMPGVFLGFCENGTLLCRMDHDDYVKEIRKDLVRVVSVLTADQVTQVQEKVDVRGQMLELEEEALELGRKAAEAARKLDRTKKTAARAAERNGGSVDPVIEEQIAVLTNEVVEAENAAIAAKTRKPKPIKLSAPAPKNPKAVEVLEPEEGSPLDPVAEGEAEVEYKEYVPAGPTTIEDIQKLETDTPLFINPANSEDDALEAVFVGITADNQVQVLVDGEEAPRVVMPESITLVT